MHLVSPEYIGGVQNVLAVCDGGIFSSKASFYYFVYIHPSMSDKYKYNIDFDVLLNYYSLDDGVIEHIITTL